MTTPQEEFWKGDFGDQYLQRNRVDWQARIPFWRSIIEQTKPESILEVGCNAGWNMRAIREVDPEIFLHGIDVNPLAVEEARQHKLEVSESSAAWLSKWQLSYDLVFTAGVLIHVGPDDLPTIMAGIIETSRKHVLAVEYDSEKEEEIPYRGHTERLWKRPFGQLYGNLGLEYVADGEAQGFDRCHFWLMSK